MTHDPYSALRFRDFRLFVMASMLYTIAILVQEVAVGYEVYTITRDPLALGLVGLAQAIPFIGLTLFGGHLADRSSKRRIILWSVSVTGLSMLLLLMSYLLLQAGTVSSSQFVAFVYGASFMIGTCRAFQSPAASSLRAFLVPKDHYENAATWSSSSFQAGSILGPAIGGFIFGWLAFSGAMLAVVVMLCIVIGGFLRVSDVGSMARTPEGPLLRSLGEGITFVWKTKPILYAISLDLFSVLFGGVVAILPVFAQDVLHVGPQGLGILRAAPSVGAVATLLLLSRFPPMRHGWRNLLIAVGGFGISILVFSFSPWILLSVAALFSSGAFDSVSVVVRQTLLQIRTPDAMRGRVMSVNGIFITSSNELGAFESGLAARLLGVVPSTVFGGVMTLVIAGFVGWKTRDLLNVRLDHPQNS